jgi:hypothetical protein
MREGFKCATKKLKKKLIKFEPPNGIKIQNYPNVSSLPWRHWWKKTWVSHQEEDTHFEDESLLDFSEFEVLHEFGTSWPQQGGLLNQRKKILSMKIRETLNILSTSKRFRDLLASFNMDFARGCDINRIQFWGNACSALFEKRYNWFRVLDCKKTTKNTYNFFGSLCIILLLYCGRYIHTQICGLCIFLQIELNLKLDIGNSVKIKLKVDYKF